MEPRHTNIRQCAVSILHTTSRCLLVVINDDNGGGGCGGGDCRPVEKSSTSVVLELGLLQQVRFHNLGAFVARPRILIELGNIHGLQRLDTLNGLLREARSPQHTWKGGGM
jgi:hypothetical protein